MGYDDYKKCSYYQSETDKAEGKEDSAEGDFLLPWSGNSFGTVDLQIVAARTKPKVIGVIGSYNAGKTTLLAVLYLLLSHGKQFGGCRFAGSYTIGGWENLAHFLRWKPGQTPHFPPHTSISAGRVPGLLHLSLRGGSGVLEDVIFTDAPGEWFDQWAVDKNALEVAGARWISRYADAFMLFADNQALAGKNRGEARTRLLNIAERLSGELGGRPSAIVWSKSDIESSENMKRRLRKRFEQLFPNHREFNVSVTCVDGKNEITELEFIQLISWLLTKQGEARYSMLHLSINRPDDPLLAFRGGER